jgi:phosphohistidine swiveling domain-containing protein
MTALNTVAKYRFPAPLEVPAPAGADGWQEMYSPYLLFSEENATWEASQFWYWDGMHRPDVEYPFDTIVHEAYMMSVAAVVSRLFSIPGAKSAASRVLNGRLYLADVPFADPGEEERRIDEFMRRGGHYFEHWPELNERWIAKVEGLTAELSALEVPTLPDLEDERVVLEGRGVNSGHRLLDDFASAVQNLFLVYQYHFEMLVLAYVAQMTFHDLARDAFPSITEQTLAKLTAGVQLRQFRPDEELKGLARLAIDLGVADRVRTAGDPAAAIAELGRDRAGAEWVAALERAKHPWFHVSTGTGLFHTERAWIDDLSVPWAAIAGYINRLERGERIDRPHDELLAERDRLTAEYRELLPSDERRAAFDQSIALARTVAPHLQDHNYLIEHRHHTIFWNKMRQFADRAVTAGLLDEQEDFFYLNRWEVGQVLFDAVNAWAQASPGLHHRWRSTVRRRREIVEALRDWIPEPAVGATPTELGGLLTAQFGITMDTVGTWLHAGADDGDELQGVGASPGVAEGPARIVLRTSDIEQVEDGEILVCPTTAPAWAPVFGRVRAIVSDVGGMMSHAAILCREYGIPAVLGTSSGTRRIATGDLVRVDGDRGTVELLGQDHAA